MNQIYWSLPIVVLGFLAICTVALSQELLGCSTGNPSYESVNTDNIEAVLIFMRHGVRAPWTSYPKDPNANNTNRWPNGRSQLTSFGIKQATNIGNLFVKRYGTFTKNLKRSQIYLRASAAQRCIDTLKLVSSRLWPNFDAAHTPLIYSLPKKVDSLLYEEPKCPFADNEETSNMNNPAESSFENMPDSKFALKLVCVLALTIKCLYFL